jgi:hypothetical protein
VLCITWEHLLCFFFFIRRLPLPVQASVHRMMVACQLDPGSEAMA